MGRLTVGAPADEREVVAPAERMLGDVNRWRPDIYEYKNNIKIIGPDPDRIEIGQKLVMPAE